MIDHYWYYYYLTPFGDILKEGETPYEHKSHPYVFKAYPFIDGEIHSFVADVIDQQRYTNRLITLYDFIMRASAKGVLLFPEGCEPDGMSMEDIAEEWGKFDGIVYYKPKPGVAVPQQIANNSTQIGITELLNLQLKFFEDISGVNGALQGKPGYANQSAALYNQQTQNATTSLLDLLDSFSYFVKDGAIKDVKNMQQFYDTKRIFNIVGKNAWVEYDPKTIRDVDLTSPLSKAPIRQHSVKWLTTYLCSYGKHRQYPSSSFLNTATSRLPMIYCSQSAVRRNSLSKDKSPMQCRRSYNSKYRLVQICRMFRQHVRC